MKLNIIYLELSCTPFKANNLSANILSSCTVAVVTVALTRAFLLNSIFSSNVMINMLLLFGLCILCRVASGAQDDAYIQIFDFVNQSKTSPMDPALVLTEVKPSSDIFVRPQKLVHDLFVIEYMDASRKAINASTYDITFQKLVGGEISYQHPFDEPLMLKPNENAAIIVDEFGPNSVLRGTVCKTGTTPVPGLDKAVVIICPDKSQTTFELDKFAVTGSNLGCLHCKTENDLKPTIVEDSVHFLIDDTNYAWNVTIRYDNKDIDESCNFVSWKLGDSGVYTIVIKESEDSSPDSKKIAYKCFPSPTVKPSDFWKPIWLTFVILIVIILVMIILMIINKRYPMLREEALKKIGKWSPEDEKEKEKKAARLQSLDTFRGLAITVMIFVNFGGGNYYFLEHASWNGLSLADFVFPWFMFMVGCSIVLSVQSQLKRNVAKTVILKKVTVRFIKLFLIGVFLNTAVPGGVDLTQLRIPGVLQRIGFTYFVCSVLEILFIPRLTAVENFGGERMKVDDNEYNECGKFLNDEPDIPDKKISNSWKYGHNSEVETTTISGGFVKNLLIHTWPQWFIIVLFTTLWGVITFVLPVPGCPTGYIGPGGIANGGLYPNCTGGAAGYIDRLIFGSHMYQHPTCKPMYKTTLAHDPEGILGSLTAVLTVYSGVVAGHMVVMLKSSRGSTIGALSVLSVVTLVIGLILCKGTITGGWVPINKNLWSISFVMITSASAYFLLGLMYLLIDFLHLWCGSPFNSAGKNPLFLYVGSYIVYSYFPFNWQTAQTHAALMLQSLVGTICWLLVGLYLDYKKKYFKI
ncbi:hypothetical protein ACHWQZ_G017915 [Mnemiopsis leidyi]